MKKMICVMSFAIALFLFALCGCAESEYSKAGKDFDNWIKDDPKTWTDTEKRYYNDFMDWVDKQ